MFHVLQLAEVFCDAQVLGDVIREAKFGGNTSVQSERICRNGRRL